MDLNLNKCKSSIAATFAISSSIENYFNLSRGRTLETIQKGISKGPYKD